MHCTGARSSTSQAAGHPEEQEDTAQTSQRHTVAQDQPPSERPVKQKRCRALQISAESAQEVDVHSLQSPGLLLLHQHALVSLMQLRRTGNTVTFCGSLLFRACGELLLQHCGNRLNLRCLYARLSGHTRKHKTLFHNIRHPLATPFPSMPSPPLHTLYQLHGDQGHSNAVLDAQAICVDKSFCCLVRDEWTAWATNAEPALQTRHSRYMLLYCN